MTPQIMLSKLMAEKEDAFEYGGYSFAKEALNLIDNLDRSKHVLESDDKLKEIKMRPVTETHDYEFKVKNAKKFIAKGDKVKFTIRFKGRELQHSHLGNELMGKIKEDMKDIGKVELHPKFDGKQMIMVIQPL